MEAPASIAMARYPSNINQYGAAADDDRSMQSSIGMASSAPVANGGGGENLFGGDEHFDVDAPAIQGSTAGGGGGGGDNGADASAEDAATLEAENAVTREREVLFKENAAKLTSILANIKNSTKRVMSEMDTFLKETEEVEKTFIRCRANTQKESQRMEQVEPDVIAATQRFVAQGAQLFGGAGGGLNFMNMAALMGAAGGASAAAGGGFDSSAMARAAAPVGSNIAGGSGYPMNGIVTPRVNNDSSSMAGSIAGSSMAGSMN